MLESYWPDADAVNACIKNEAETADAAVLLAVHQPVAIVRRAEGSEVTTPATELDLLEAFTTENVPGGYVLLPITGVSGVGKSHIVRWLDAQLQRSAKRDRYHIIRIPKSASLRTVVELILAPLKDNPQYTKPWQDLTRAVAEVNLDSAVVTFRAHLENALTARRAELIAEFKQNPDRSDLRQLIGYSGDLPKLFSDAALAEHFKTILARVLSRALSGRSGEVEQADTLSRFVASDLILPKEVDISKAAQRVRDYYKVNIAMVGLERLEPAVDLLNKAIDPAISNVFQLEQSTGGITLQEIILSVREILFQEGKDLVLLVEDFAALAGIQEVLLKVCIQEGEYAGEKVRATMRTALALTDGHLNFRDTILTRARWEWVIGGRLQGDDEIKASVVDMVGAYLNAARWGSADLKRLFRQRGPEQSLTDWLPLWRDEDLNEADSDAVAAFGSASNGAPLFPFNREAIDALAGRILLKGGKLELNPRRVINQILRSTLLLRKSFEAHNFPTPEFQGFRPNATLASWIKQTHQPDSVSGRLSTLLALWGGNPPDVAAIKHISPAIFTAFHLPPPSELANIGFVAPPPPAPPTTSEGKTEGGGAEVATRVVDMATEDPRVTDLRVKLEKWSGGTALEQRDANELRKALMDMVRDAIDWPALRMRSVDLPPNWIEIPQARGNLNTKISVADDAKDADGSVRAGLLAAFRFATVNNRRWSYAQADDDYIASATIVDRLIAQLNPILVRAAHDQAAALSRALITQSRIIGLEPALKPTTSESALKALFAKPEPKATQIFEESWDRLRSNASAAIDDKPGRERLQTELLERTAAFQGTGRTAFGIDIVRLIDALGDDAAARGGGDQLPQDVKDFIRPIAEVRLKNQLSPVVAKLKSFNAQISAYIDDSFDKAAFVADLHDIGRLLAMTGTHINLLITLKEFERRLIEFQASAIKDLVSKVATIVDGDLDQIPKALNSLGALDFGLIDRTMTFLGHTTSLIKAAEDSVAREEANRGQADPATLVAEITAMLTTIAQPDAQEATP
ncbi:protein DpdH [Mesorhizobium sp. B2-8-5]|uniref:protein DpdH n=1 Tax=Mesorhizobium sp. B2-8-5 TaxID=2589903 RepID=UPI00112BB57D|nr:protein DpdH [Mesorhizobium sp. B2-8-5]UCI23524.1 ATP-binding protein [Mesorhizobium sp. B2-8-5]